MNSTLVLSANLSLTGLVQQYREESISDTNSLAASVLLVRFHPYLLKWIRLLSQGKWDRRDREIRHFLQMMGGPDIDKTAYSISLRMEAYEKEDIEQEVRLVFLQTALNTKSIRQHFRFALQKKIVGLLKDPLVFNRKHHLPVNEAVTNYPVATDIDDLWVAGFTCGPGFDELTPDERKVLQLHHYYGYTIERTANALGISTATVSRVICKVKKVLSNCYTTP